MERAPCLVSDFVQIGSHVPFQNVSITDTLKWALSLGMYSTQFYMGSQRGYTRARISDKDIESTKQLLQQFPMNVFTHSPVTYNLAGSVGLKSLAWSGNKEVDDMMDALVKSLTYELSVLNKIGAKGTVIHPGCYLKKDKMKPEERETARDLAITAIANTLNKVKHEGSAKILLENAAGENGKAAFSLEHLSKIRDKCDDKEHIGFCIDTAHIQGSGVYNLSKCEEVDRMICDFEKYGHVELVHLNDSEVKLGCCVDRHELLGHGHIWGKDITSLVYLLKRLGDLKIPLVLETSPSDMKLLYQLTQNLG